MLNKNQVIFVLDRDDYDYKGIFFAEVDLGMTCEDFAMGPAPKDYVVGVMGVIWTDEKGCWHGKMRLKFPSGTKQVIESNFEKELKEGINMNETYVLNHMYKLPMINKIWRKNPDGTSEGIVKIMQDLDMVEYSRIVENEK